jgi:uncharacterized membrane protein YdbT with pleckstrin-like domain
MTRFLIGLLACTVIGAVLVSLGVPVFSWQYVLVMVMLIVIAQNEIYWERKKRNG